MVKSILLCGGRINYLNLPIRSNTSNSMIPVNGKPVISWILEDLSSKGLTDLVLVHRADDVHLQQFLDRSYSTRFNLQLVSLENSPSILHSLQAGLSTIEEECSFNIILGDTLIRDSFDHTADTIYTARVEDSTRWCIVDTDEQQNIKQFYDKKDNLEIDLIAVCGYYYITRHTLFYKLLLQSILDGATQLSDVLGQYSKHQPIKAKRVSTWYDFGNIDRMLEAKRDLLQSRYFNSLSIHPVLNTITKESEFDEKLRNELNWYEELPPELSVLAPRILYKEERNSKLVFTQEYYGYPTLSELYLYSDLNHESWHAILKKLLQIEGEFQKYTSTLSQEDLYDVYVDKTFQRVQDLTGNDDFWGRIFSAENVVVNGELFRGFASLEQKIRVFAYEMIAKSTICIIHGDLCFSNILFDINSQIVKLIDPRGSFGQKGIYGDPRYDMSKLRHSISGLYDYIVSDLFQIHCSDNEFTGSVFVNETPSVVSREFDHLLEAEGYNLDEIRFIEGLLFISMLPLHRDKPHRQRMMFVQGIKLLNEVLN